MAVLTGPRREAKSGNPKSLVIFLHGYGADGNDLIGLADPLAEHLPDTVFLSPNAPQRCPANPMGYQWFPISWLDGSPESAMIEGAKDAARILDRYLTEAMAEEGRTPAETCVVGFSQGTMMILQVAPRRVEPLAGIVGFSGRLNDPEKLPAEIKSRPPVLLVHGDQDQMVPVDSIHAAREGLAEAGIDVRWHISRGIGHGIAPDGLGLALGFLKERLGA
jgi:phospholipase/carboxylesterase